MNLLKRRILPIAILWLSFVAWAWTANDTVRVLAIGNSFSWDAVEQELYPLCHAAGQEIVIGNLYYGGCSLAQHYYFMTNHVSAYSFRLIKDGVRTATPNGSVSLREALQYGKWDYISLQQASHDSGIKSTFEPYLSALEDTVKAYQPEAKLLWHETWSYSKDAAHPAYKLYHHSQTEMDDSIAACKAMVTTEHPELRVIPAGTAIRLARKTRLGDTLCRDGYHLNYSYGRYLAACVWYEVLTGKNARKNPYAPDSVSKKQKRICRRIAHKAVKNNVQK